MIHGAIHVFADRPDLETKAFCRQLEAALRERISLDKMQSEFLNTEPKSARELVTKYELHGDIVQYPHAVSLFSPIKLSYDYLAASLSKRRKAPVLVSIAAQAGSKAAVRTFWGFEGRCIAEAETICDADLSPLEYVARLERELGIFIGSTPLEDFLSTCTKVKETEYATVYKSDRLA